MVAHVVSFCDHLYLLICSDSKEKLSYGIKSRVMSNDTHHKTSDLNKHVWIFGGGS